MPSSPAPVYEEAILRDLRLLINGPTTLDHKDPRLGIAYKLSRLHLVRVTPLTKQTAQIAPTEAGYRALEQRR